MKAKSIFVVLAATLCVGSTTYSALNNKETNKLNAAGAYGDDAYH